MIHQFVIGSGNARKVVPLVRDRDQRHAAGLALRAFLFPNTEAHSLAMVRGKRRAAKYRQRQARRGAGA